ncbi:MAG: site-specific DNA-methyltransferase [Thermoplasmatales archaeon]|nr:site-specific DNA-methyltransferase [Thermoplasmatales archaeon]
MGLVINDKEWAGKYKLKDIQNKIILGDTIEVMKKMKPKSVDMVFIDPPYFLQLPKKRLIRWEVKTDVEGVNEQWDKFASFKEYDNFIKKLLKGVKRVMKPNATIWVIGTYHNIFRTGKIMYDLGFWMLNDVSWFKTNPMPNWLNVRFTNATETLLWAVKDKKVKKYVYNKEVAREYSMKDFNSKIVFNVWRLPICMGGQRLKNADGKKLHSTQKPEALLERIIRISTNPDDVVFDPVAGTGTTGYVAKKLGRNFIMIDKEEKYVKAMQKRLKGLQTKL